MSPNKPLIALLTTAMAATFGYAVAQDSTATSTTTSYSMTPQPAETTTKVETQTVTIPGRTTGVVPSMPAGTYTAAPGSVEPNSVMTTGVNFGSTRINVGDHATPMLPAPPEVLSVTSQTTTTSVPVAHEETHVAQTEAAPAPAPVQEEAAAPAQEPTPAPRHDRN